MLVQLLRVTAILPLSVEQDIIRLLIQLLPHLYAIPALKERPQLMEPLPSPNAPLVLQAIILLHLLLSVSLATQDITQRLFLQLQLQIVLPALQERVLLRLEPPHRTSATHAVLVLFPRYPDLLIVHLARQATIQQSILLFLQQTASPARLALLPLLLRLHHLIPVYHALKAVMLMKEHQPVLSVL